MEHTYAVIMAGGVGSRFWPASRAKTPKQLLDLSGSGAPMVAGTVARLLPDVPPERILVVTGRILVDAIAAALPELPRENILAEPVGRNTAPCIGWATVHVLARDPDGVMAVMPSDHLVENKSEFLKNLRVAVDAARDGAMITFGVTPRGPETGFGYIEMGEEVSDGVRRVERFVEKPDAATAQKYVDAGNFTWNSGMFFFTARQIMEEIYRQMPELGRGLDEIAAAIGKPEQGSTVERVFPTLPSESIDYGIMEHAAEICCVPVSFGWFDVGSWDAAYDLFSKDENRNAVRADVLCHNTTGCLVQANDSKKLLALVDVKDLVVVDTGDALLICSREKTQNVKNIVNMLKAKGRKELL